ncbi:hypothetical protein J6590_060526, partial [Homalodisca vitripennis]
MLYGPSIIRVDFRKEVSATRSGIKGKRQTKSDLKRIASFHDIDHTSSRYLRLNKSAELIDMKR